MAVYVIYKLRRFIFLRFIIFIRLCFCVAYWAFIIFEKQK